mmetsp:Transcript_4880/g.17719  ORF Transcript_4880/g.17719 Transcript_4880/m.17719 type:complete len:328 (-) Transcript_4880:85-1068(-)
MLRMLETQDNKEEFVRFRNRKGLRKSEDPTGAGVSMFIGRRWRDPEDASDRRVLEEGHAKLQSSFPIYAAHCSISKLLEVVRSIRHSWNLLCMELDAREASRSPSQRESESLKTDSYHSESFSAVFPQASVECGKRFRHEFEQSAGSLSIGHVEYPPVYHTVGSVQLNGLENGCDVRPVSESPPSAPYFYPVQLPNDHGDMNSWGNKRMRHDEEWRQPLSCEAANRVQMVQHECPVMAHSQDLRSSHCQDFGTLCVLEPMGGTLIVRESACRSYMGEERTYQLPVDSQAMWMDLHAKSVFDDFDFVRKSDDWYGWNRLAHCPQPVHS